MHLAFPWLLAAALLGAPFVAAGAGVRPPGTVHDEPLSGPGVSATPGPSASSLEGASVTGRDSGGKGLLGPPALALAGLALLAALAVAFRRDLDA